MRYVGMLPLTLRVTGAGTDMQLLKGPETFDRLGANAVPARMTVSIGLY